MQNPKTQKRKKQKIIKKNESDIDATTGKSQQNTSALNGKKTLEKPSEDLLSFSSNTDVNKTESTSKTANAKATEDDWFTESNDKKGQKDWDPWINETNTTAVTNKWDDDLWSSNATQSSSTTTSNVTTKPNSQNLTSLYQNSNSNPATGNAFYDKGSGNVGMPNMDYSPMVGGMSMWGGAPNAPNNNNGTGFVTSTPQPAPFLGVLNQVNQQKQEELERKKIGRIRKKKIGRRGRNETKTANVSDIQTSGIKCKYRE